MLLIALIGSLITFGGAASLMARFGFIEGIIYLTKSDEQFAATYVQGNSPNPTRNGPKSGDNLRAGLRGEGGRGHCPR